ncbi:MAG: hypothetical protein KDD37_04180 [Bdellovibrionales bacterium]|nr:hypothetical protein [Bdellovibrionales bacterium]
MKWLLVGHRGTGKTSLLRRLETYFPTATCFDLDEEIAKRVGSNLVDYFNKQGEISFRQIELQTIRELMQSKSSYIIACGAGLLLDQLTTDAEKIWIRRYTDKLGRVFLDRPRLQKESLPLDEYMHRYRERNIMYQKYATEIVDIPEGFDAPNEAERDFFQQTFDMSEWTVTLQSYHFRNPDVLKLYLSKRVSWGLNLELRDDLLTKEQIHQALQIIPSKQALISFRQKNASKDLLTFVQKNQIPCDWDLELGEPPFTPTIVSLHKCKTIEEGLATLSKYTSSIQKAAFTTEDLEDVWRGDQWLTEANNRAFLPCSDSGLWNWYRLYRSHRQAVQFLADQTHSQLDQPQVLDAIRQQDFDEPNHFAAVIGNPVGHSLSPGMHYEFFLPYSIPFYAVPLKNWNIEILKKLGLKFAAVTSPFKTDAFSSAELLSDTAKHLKSVNTLVIDKKIEGHNTDVDGLKATLGYAQKPTAIWGGGGLLSSILANLPEACAYSSRTGQAKGNELKEKPKTLIWSVGRSQFEQEGVFPPADWKPEIIIDMNYTDDSYGKTYAQSIQAEYISGMTLFLEQARKQQEIWGKKLPL